MGFSKVNHKFARCVKQLGFYTRNKPIVPDAWFARCVKQLGFYTPNFTIGALISFARCVKQLGFYTYDDKKWKFNGLLGVLNN